MIKINQWHLHRLTKSINQFRQFWQQNEPKEYTHYLTYKNAYFATFFAVNLMPKTAFIKTEIVLPVSGIAASSLPSPNVAITTTARRHRQTDGGNMPLESYTGVNGRVISIITTT